MEYKNLEQMILENENFKLALNSALHKNDVSGSVLLGDCLELLPLFANKSVDYSFTSPPYNRKRNDKYRDFTDINENWLQLNIAQMFLNDTKPAIFYTRCYLLVRLI